MTDDARIFKAECTKYVVLIRLHYFGVYLVRFGGMKATKGLQLATFGNVSNDVSFS